MDSAEVQLASLLESISGLRDILLCQTRQIDHCLQILKLNRDKVCIIEYGEPKVFDVILTMIHMVGISGHSILKLTEDVNLNVRDAFPIARSIIEGSINICYIMAKGSSAAMDARRHSTAKSISDFLREVDIDGISIQNKKIDKETIFENNSELKDIVAEYSTNRGHTKNWIKLSIKQRLDVISQRFNKASVMMFHVPNFNVYSCASEIVHGSFFGAEYFWGMTEIGKKSPKTSDELRVVLANHQCTVLTSVIFSYSGLIECFSDYVQMLNIRKESELQVNRMKMLPYISEVTEAVQVLSKTPR